MQHSEIDQPRQSMLGRVSIVLYATLAILWLAIPQSVSNWSREYLPDFAQPVVAPVTQTVESIANATRIPMLYELAREFFQSTAKK